MHKNSNHIAIFDGDCEQHFGNVPSDLSPAQINVAIYFYRAGFNSGRAFGAIDKQQEIRRALGLN